MFIGDLSVNGKLALFVFGAGGILGLLVGLLISYLVIGSAEKKHRRLREAVSAIYYAATWYPDRPVVNEVTLWSTLRDTAGFEKGKSPKHVKWTATTLGLGPYTEDEIEPLHAVDHEPIDQPDGFSS